MFDHIAIMTTTEVNDYARSADRRQAEAVARERDNTFAASWQRAVLLAAMRRLGSSEAFETSRSIDPVRDAELLARMDYARSLSIDPPSDEGADRE